MPNTPDHANNEIEKMHSWYDSFPRDSGGRLGATQRSIGKMMDWVESIKKERAVS